MAYDGGAMTDTWTHLTFQHHRAADAVELYTRVIPASSIDARRSIGDDGMELIRFTLAGRPFIAVDSPPVHRWDFSPAVSVYLVCDSVDEVDRIYAALSDGGTAFMPVGSYPFNSRFGWCADRFGVSWQVGLSLWPA